MQNKNIALLKIYNFIGLHLLPTLNLIYCFYALFVFQLFWEFNIKKILTINICSNKLIILHYSKI